MAQIGHGTTVTGVTTGLIGEVFGMTGPDQSVDDVEVTSFDSANSAKEFIPGLIDAGGGTLQVNYDSAAAGTADMLQTALNARTIEAWTFEHSDGSKDVVTGFINALGKATPNGDKVTQNVGFKFTGIVVYTDIV